MDEGLGHTEGYLDMENALARVRGNKKLFGRMLGLFLESPDFAALEDNLSKGDYEKAEQSAHTIKGVAGNLALNILFEKSAELMQQLRQGAPQEETLAQYRDALEKTKGIVGAVIAEINAE